MRTRENVQSLALYSATFSNQSLRQAHDYLMDDFVYITCQERDKYDDFELKPVNAPSTNIEQSVKLTYKQEKLENLMDILKINLNLKNEDSKNKDQSKIMIFCNSRKRCVSIATYILLSFPEINVSTMHGNMSQLERDFSENEFRIGNTRIMVCTDVICRGHDSGGVNLVVQYDLPFGTNCTDQDKYIHRIGRAGRAGNRGKSIAFFDPEQDEKLLGKLREWVPVRCQPEFLRTYEGSLEGKTKSRLNDFVRPVCEF